MTARGPSWADICFGGTCAISYLMDSHRSFIESLPYLPLYAISGVGVGVIISGFRFVVVGRQLDLPDKVGRAVKPAFIALFAAVSVLLVLCLLRGAYAAALVLFLFTFLGFTFALGCVRLWFATGLSELVQRLRRRTPPGE